MEPEASEFPKNLMLYGGGHVHIRHITLSSLVDVGCYIKRAIWPFDSRLETDANMVMYCSLKY